MEEVVFDEDGQPLTGSLMDYAVPRAVDFPMITLEHTTTPSPWTAHGAKGVGEAGQPALRQPSSTPSSTPSRRTASRTSTCRSPLPASGPLCSSSARWLPPPPTDPAHTTPDQLRSDPTTRRVAAVLPRFTPASPTHGSLRKQTGHCRHRRGRPYDIVVRVLGIGSGAGGRLVAALRAADRPLTLCRLTSISATSSRRSRTCCPT